MLGPPSHCTADHAAHWKWGALALGPPWAQGRGTGALWGASRLSAVEIESQGVMGWPRDLGSAPSRVPEPLTALPGAWPGPRIPDPPHTPLIFIASLTVAAGVAACRAKTRHHQPLPQGQIQPKGEMPNQPNIGHLAAVCACPQALGLSRCHIWCRFPCPKAAGRGVCRRRWVRL